MNMTFVLQNHKDSKRFGNKKDFYLLRIEMREEMVVGSGNVMMLPQILMRGTA
jgi:hypothetical protein